MPRFSIVITTRNRSDLVLNSLQSVLEQDFGDFDVIVSDNSDNDHAASVAAAINPFLSDARLRYIRPPRPLPMTAHWEWAVEQALGEYVGILTDRMVFRLYTLSAVDAVIRASRPSVVSFERTNFIEVPQAFAVSPVKGISITTRPTLDKIQAFARADFRPMDTPRFLNGFASAEFLSHLRTEYGSVFTGTSPDYGFLMRVLDQLDEFPFIETPLLIKHSENRSNGKSFTHLNLTKTSQDFLEFTRREQSEFLTFSPIPDDLIMVPNVMMREYEIGRHNQRSGRFMLFDKQLFYNESMKHLVTLKNNSKDVALLLERMERYRADNHLTGYRLSGREWRRYIKARVRTAIGLKPAKTRKRKAAEISLFPSMIEALRDDALRFKPTRSLKNAGSHS
ncbi:MAG: glycosyltransferase [Hyphomicrobiales bacterium]|nr:glycosyltransferase [Hyphomicrobiales bacterium]